MSERNETNEMWRRVKQEKRERLNRQDARRLERFHRLLAHPDIIMRRRLGEHGYRLSHYEWPAGRYVDFWPRTSVFTGSRGFTGKGWRRLLAALEVRPGPWEHGNS